MSSLYLCHLVMRIQIYMLFNTFNLTKVNRAYDIITIIVLYDVKYMTFACYLFVSPVESMT